MWECERGVYIMCGINTLHPLFTPSCCSHPALVHTQLLAIMDRYKLELVTAGKSYVRVCKVGGDRSV